MDGLWKGVAREGKGLRSSGKGGGPDLCEGEGDSLENIIPMFLSTIDSIHFSRVENHKIVQNPSQHL